jgi:hypothetical protein
MSIIAKLSCASVTNFGASEEVKFYAAHGPGNESWSKATPSGNVTITISNPEARGKFTPGKDYTITFAPAES